MKFDKKNLRDPWFLKDQSSICHPKTTNKFNKYLLELNNSNINFAKDIPTVEQFTIRRPFQAGHWTVMCTADMHCPRLCQKKCISFYHLLLIRFSALSTSDCQKPSSRPGYVGHSTLRHVYNYYKLYHLNFIMLQWYSGKYISRWGDNASSIK